MTIIKKVGIWLLALVLLLGSGLSPKVVQAQSGPQITASAAKVIFPSSIDFSLSAQSDVNITDVRLHYTVEQMSYAQVTAEAFVSITPASKVDAKWTWDMRKTGGLPPGIGIDYWWTVKDSSGKVLKTETAHINFDDQRHKWQILTQGLVTLYWYEGDQAFVSALMSATQQALTQLQNSTGADLKEQVKLYIYASAQDVQSALIFPQEWTGGVTFTGFRTIAIGIPPSNLAWGERAIAHEFTHLVIGQMVYNAYNQPPTWLDEGLAMYNEGPIQEPFASSLKQAVTTNSLISVRSLTSPFSAFPQQAYLSYAESYSIVEYLITTYGQSKMLDLLTTFRQGSGYDDALNKVYGFDMDGLNASWRAYMNQQYKVTQGPSVAIPVLVGQGA